MKFNSFFRQVEPTCNRIKSIICCMMLVLVIIISCQEPSTQQEEATNNAIDVDFETKGIRYYLTAVPGTCRELCQCCQEQATSCFLAGNGPNRTDGSVITGKLGEDLSIEEGYEAARLTAINQLSVWKAALGDLNKVKRIVKVLGMVNSDPSFVE